MTNPARTDNPIKTDSPVRIDKWLWAARFFKTRSLARQAVQGGKVHLNGNRAKPSRTLAAGDRLTVQRADVRFEIDVLVLTDRRGPASVAQTLYRETDAGRQEREDREAARQAEKAQRLTRIRRPDKRQRRQLLKAKGR